MFRKQRVLLITKCKVVSTGSAVAELECVRCRYIYNITAFVTDINGVFWHSSFNPDRSRLFQVCINIEGRLI